MLTYQSTFLPQAKVGELERALEASRGEALKAGSASLAAASNLKMLLEAKEQELQKTQMQVRRRAALPVFGAYGATARSARY